MRWEDEEWRARMRVRLDFNGVWDDRVGGHGLPLARFEAEAARWAEAHASLEVRREAGGLAWTDLPYQTDAARELTEFGRYVAGRFENLVVLGIGAASGAKALHAALTHPYWNLLPRDTRGGPRLFVLDTGDPVAVSGLLDLVDPGQTLFQVVSKSGATAETMAQFLVFRRALVNLLGERYREHIVATTDPAEGVLRLLARQEGYPVFAIPPEVDERFGALSAAGLLSAAACGVDLAELLAGARYADETVRAADPWRNAALMAAALHWLAYRQGQTVAILLPFADALSGVADWFRRLWAASLGKRLDREGRVVHVGPTPVSASGAADLHSGVQSYVEGPSDKLVHFFLVDEYGREAPIPELRTRVNLPDPRARAARDQVVTDLGYLGGELMSHLVQAEARAVAATLAEAGRPCLAHRLPQVNAFTIGQLLFLLQLQTAYAAELFEVNAYDQPGVEAARANTYALMNRAGYEVRRAEIEAAEAQRRDEWII